MRKKVENNFAVLFASPPSTLAVQSAGQVLLPLSCSQGGREGGWGGVAGRRVEKGGEGRGTEGGEEDMRGMKGRGRSC